MNLRHYIDPGELDRKITIQTASASGVDAFGESTSTWYTYAQPWARMEWKTGNEGEDAQQIANKEVIEFLVRYDSGITPKMRISYDSDLFDIESISQVGGRQRFQLLRCITWDSNNIG